LTRTFISQVEIIAAYGEQLEWLNHMTMFRQRKRLEAQPAFHLLDELLRNGTTTLVLQPFILSLLMLFLRKQAVVTYA